METRIDGIGRVHDRAALAPTRTALADQAEARIAAARAAITRSAVLPGARTTGSQAAEARVLGPAPLPVQFAAAPAAPPPAPSTSEMAAMSAAVYAPGTVPPTGWRIASPTQLAEIGLTPAMLTSPASEFRAEVYVRDFGGQTSYTVAFRGSQSASDWRSNLQQSTGFRSDHYNRALEIAQALTVPQGARVTLTGHSLGGGLASAAALAAELDAVTFNAAGLSQTTLGDARVIAARDGQVTTPDISAYYVRGEVLSALQDGGDRVLGAILGGIPGALVADLPEAVGTRIALDPVRPDGLRWWQDNPVSKHFIDYVIASVEGA